MSFKQITVAKCDLCGHTENATPGIVGREQLLYFLPDGWGVAATNQNIHLCPACMAKLQDRPRTAAERRGRT